MRAGIPCEKVWQQISGYVDGSVGASLRQRMDQHFKTCKGCKAVLDGTRNVVELVSDQRALELPANVSRRLYSKLEAHLQASSTTVRPTLARRFREFPSVLQMIACNSAPI